jgi:hypothetical protein
MKTPHDISLGMKNRQTGGVFRETFRLPYLQARKRVKRTFKQFPTTAYMTEIEIWRELEGQKLVECTLKRLVIPIDGQNE